MHSFWELFWRVYGVFMIGVGVYSLWKAGQTCWLMLQRMPPARRPLRPLLKAWLLYALFFLTCGNLVFITAPYTADLFSTPVVTVVVASSVFLWLLVWLVRRHKVKKLRMTGSDRTQ